MSNSNIYFNVDTQQDFFDRDGIDIPNNESVLKNLSLICDFLNKNNLKTIHSIRWFNLESDFFSEMPDYTKKFPKHCIKDTKGARFISQTAPKEYFLMNWMDNNIMFPEIHNNRNIVVTKKLPNFFDGNSFSEALINNLGVPFMERPSFYLFGVDIDETALSLLRRGYTVYVVTDANIKLNGQSFQRENILNSGVDPETGKQAKEVSDLKFITTKELLS
jgi:nicotinamidase-related amidase